MKNNEKRYFVAGSWNNIRWDLYYYYIYIYSCITDQLQGLKVTTEPCEYCFGPYYFQALYGVLVLLLKTLLDEFVQLIQFKI